MRVIADTIVDHYKLKGLLMEDEDDSGVVRAVAPSAEVSAAPCDCLTFIWS